jgi:hypothetical protein
MSNGIYDILGKLNGLQPKDNPVSMSAEPVYESIDPQDITPAVDSLEEKYQNFLAEEKSKKSQSQKDAEISRGEPEIVKLLNKARLERPSAASDTEALAYQMVKANKELEKANAANDEQETKIADLQAKVSASPTAVAPAPVAVPTQTPSVQPTAVTPTAPAAKPSATILRMPTPVAEPKPVEVPAPATTTTQPAPVVTKPTRTYSPSTRTKQPALIGKGVEKTLDKPASNVVQGNFGRKQIGGADFDPTMGLAPIKLQATTGGPAFESKKINESKQMIKLQEWKDGDEQLGALNYNILLDAWQKRLPKIDLEYSGRHLTIWASQMYGILKSFAMQTNQERRSELILNTLSSYNTTVEFMMNKQVSKFINQYPQFQKVDPKKKEQQAKVAPGQTDMFSGNSKLPQGSRNEEMQENLGNDTMQENVKTSSILKAVHQVEDKKLRESAKPDFLDLDKDGDTDEPMKSAAKTAKDDEPAEVDSDAVAKRKRLQALKDKQEDERAEKGDDYKSSSRFVKGRAYGGAAQKDDEEKDELEEGKFKEIYTDMMDYATKKGYSSHKQFTPADYDALAKPHGISGKELAVALGHKKVSQVAEVAPPGAKAERMVKHIKKGYSKDGNLSKKEKGIAYATAWKAHNKGQVEEGTNFGDTIKNSEGKMTKVKVTEGKDAIRNHPIYTTKEAWDHYSQELAEQEMMEQSMMEAPAVDVQQELDEIAKLAGLAPKMEAKSVCPSCNCEKCECNENLDPMVPADSASPLTHTSEGMGCTMEELQEAMSRKDYRTMANKIKNMDDRDLAGEMCQTFAEMAKADNPRFKEDMFFAACDVKNPASVLVDEEAMDEGNEFTKARLDAIAQGKDTFSVSGKTYKVSGDTSDEKTQVESVNEDINVNITANGEQDALNLLRKLSGMAEVPQVTGIAIPMDDESATCGACGTTPCGCEESVEEERDIELANTPHETVAPINAVTTDAGGGLGGVKKQYPLAANRGANPLEEEKLWTAYESMINDVKA